MNITPRFKEQHSSVILSGCRYKVLVAGRRWGKTAVALWLLFMYAIQNEHRHCYYLAPNRCQAKRIAWYRLKDLIPAPLVRSISETELRLGLYNGSTIELHGATTPESLRGCGLDFIVLDEYASMRAEVWEEVVRPMLADREGGALFVGTPTGFNHFYELFAGAQCLPDWMVFQFPTRDGGYVSDLELATIRSQMDPRRYRQEFEASFEAAEGRVYYAFARARNVTELDLISGEPLLVGMDFNVSRMCAVVTQRAGDESHVLDEIVLENSNTMEMMQELNRRFGPGRGVVHPDPSAKQRKTCAPVGQTDLVLIRQAGWPAYDQTKPYPIKDRLNTVNAMLRNAEGRSRLLIAPRCKHLIRSLESLTYKPGGEFIDKSSGLDHISDALGYVIMGVFPMVQTDTWTNHGPQMI